MPEGNNYPFGMDAMDYRHTLYCAVMVLEKHLSYLKDELKELDNKIGL